jgi:uncharacterized membrane protein
MMTPIPINPPTKPVISALVKIGNNIIGCLTIFGIIILTPPKNLVGGLIGIGGTKESAGFGIIGLVGPISAFRFMEHSISYIFNIFIYKVLIKYPITNGMTKNAINTKTKFNIIECSIKLLPIFTNALITGLVGGLIGIGGTKESAGFGIIG